MDSNRFVLEVVGIVSKGAGISRKRMLELLEKPPENIDSDLALPCFALAKELKKSPVDIAKGLSEKVKPTGVVKNVRAIGPYLNFYADWGKMGMEVLNHVIAEGEKYGSSKEGRGKTIVVDMSSPNIAKPMSVGHLRSTIIGDSICRTYRFLGYKAIGDNHLGDWGTQFGKLIYAYKKWGSAKELEKEPIKQLLSLYVKYHEVAENDISVGDEAKEIFRKLEEGNKEYHRLWKRFVYLSMKEFKKTYGKLGVEFDLELGESFYISRAKKLIGLALRKGAAKKSEGAVVIEVDPKKEIPPLVIQKTDESTLYSTRDLACLQYRLAKFRPDRIVYAVGSEQTLYFTQLFRAAERLGFITKKEMDGGRLVHAPFGLVSLPEGRMSTRKGRIILLDDLVSKSVELAEQVIKEKNPQLSNKKKVAEQVGIGAIKYNDLSRDRIKDVKFDWSEMLSFDGDTAPYLQYTYARACSILRKSGKRDFGAKEIDVDPKEIMVIKGIMEFPETVRNAARDLKPHYVANQCYRLAKAFNEFYQSVPVLKAGPQLIGTRLALVKAASLVLKSGLDLLGIEVPEEM